MTRLVVSALHADRAVESCDILRPRSCGFAARSQRVVFGHTGCVLTANFPTVAMRYLSAPRRRDLLALLNMTLVIEASGHEVTVGSYAEPANDARQQQGVSRRWIILRTVVLVGTLLLTGYVL